MFSIAPRRALAGTRAGVGSAWFRRSQLSKIRGSTEGLVEWSRRDPWRQRMGEMVENHLRKACDLNDIDIYDLDEVIGDPPRNI